jgi:acyl-CoA synthetase (AMP-forming)/AMP-acid ligase II
MDGSMAAMARRWARERPDAPAFSVAGSDPEAPPERLTYRQLDGLSSRFAQGLLAHGVGPGERVGFLGRSVLTWAVCLVGASKARAVGVPLNWRLSRGETAAVLADADPALVVCEPEFLGLLGETADGGPGGGAVGEPLLVAADGGQCPLGQWWERYPALDPGSDPGAADPDDIALLFYTSGTTGRAKGVQLTDRNIAAYFQAPMPWEIGPGDVVSVPAPLFHVSGSGWVFYCLAVGAHGLFTRQVVPAEVLRRMESERVTHALTVPAVVRMLAREPVAAEVDLSALRMLIYGGSPISPAVMREARRVLGCELVQSYGMTETTGPITFLDAADHAPDAPAHRLASAGRPVPGLGVEVRDPAGGEPLPAGEVGEICVRGGTVMAGYRNRPEEQAAAFTADHWFRTGDAGRFDEDGYLYVTDRVKDMIVSGAENVYPVEVENVLMDHPLVAEAAVIGVPDERWGETVKAVVVRTAGASALPSVELEAELEAELIRFCREQIAHYKCPTSVDMPAELPRNASGKVLKRELRAAHRPANEPADGPTVLASEGN